MLYTVSKGGQYPTIAAALAAVGPNGAGHIVEVTAGTYVEQIDSNTATFPMGASWPGPFTLRAKAGDVVKIANSGELNLRLFSNQPFYSIITGFVFDAANLAVESSQVKLGSSTNGGSYVRLVGNEFVNNIRTHALFIGGFTRFSEVLVNRFHGGQFFAPGGGAGGMCYPIYVSGSDNTINDNELWDFPYYGVHVYNGSTPYPSRNTVSNNRIHDYGQGASGMNGILVYNGDGNQILTNALWNGPAAPIGIGPSASNTLSAGNTYVPPSGGTQPPIPIPPEPAPTVNFVDVHTDRVVTIASNKKQITIVIDAATNILVNGAPR